MTRLGSNWHSCIIHSKLLLGSASLALIFGLFPSAFYVCKYCTTSMHCLVPTYDPCLNVTYLCFAKSLWLLGILFREYISCSIFLEIRADPPSNLWLWTFGEIERYGCSLCLETENFLYLFKYVLDMGIWMWIPTFATTYCNIFVSRAARNHSRTSPSGMCILPSRNSPVELNNFDIRPVFHTQPIDFPNVQFCYGNLEQVLILQRQNEEQNQLMWLLQLLQLLLELSGSC